MEKELKHKERMRACLDFQVKSLQQRVDMPNMREVRKCQQFSSDYLYFINIWRTCPGDSQLQIFVKHYYTFKMINAFSWTKTQLNLNSKHQVESDHLFQNTIWPTGEDEIVHSLQDTF